MLLNVALLRPSPANLEAITTQLPLSDAASLRVLRAASFRPVALRDGASFLRLALPLSEAGRISVLREQKDFRRRFLRASGGIARLPVKVSFDLMAMASKELPVEPLEKVRNSCSIGSFLFYTAAEALVGARRQDSAPALPQLTTLNNVVDV